MNQAKYPYEPWSVTEEGFHPENLQENESVFALGNGRIGMRGNLEENAASGAESIQGTFLNGVFDSEPITYGETAYGYAKNHETICNVMDAKSLVLAADGETLDLCRGHITGHRRTLDLRSGLLHRTFRWETASGAVLEADMQRLVSLTEQALAATRTVIRCRSGKCVLRLQSGIRPAVIAAGDPNDPRGASGKDRTLATTRTACRDSLIMMQQATKRSGFFISCAVNHRVTGSIPCRTEKTDQSVLWECCAELTEGSEITLEKSICYTSGREETQETCWQQAEELCLSAPSFAQLAAAQQSYLDAFWDGAGMEIDGDDALLQGLRFNLFHLLQAAGRDGKSSVAAKGLTGEGYEGHFFWDTEAYMLPVFLHTEPQVARKLLEYRYSILPNARRRARVMGHPAGALFAWRTIDGEECSAYFPAGTAQYHINGDIAHAVEDYYYVTRDMDFLAEYGAEIVVETARLYRDLGFFSDEKNGRFVLNCVTGPDEYNVLVNNNVYTNRMAEANFRFAADTMDLLREERPEDYRRLCGKIGFRPEEAGAWREAAEKMYYPPARDGIYPQDDDFLNRKPWPLDSIPAENHPLLMYYHGLTIYRHMVCKQADLILAMTLFGDEYTLEEKKKNFAFYDRVTTHDSSLSMAVFSILASEIGDVDTAYRYFMTSARLDLDDMHHNARDGLHLANMAGTWNGLVKGFAGMRYAENTLSFAPVCPKEWKGYSFRVRFRGRTIDVRVTHEGAVYRLVEGAPLTIRERGRELQLKMS